ncbi:MAG: anion transporter [Fervidicoccaceae archaeon]|nr:anion transporter [Fervidicoccaceae archaeon]
MVSYAQLIGALIIVYLVSALVFRSRRPAVPIWSLMAFSAFVTVVSGLVSIDELGSVIDMNVILFLIGMFSLVGLAEDSGLLQALSYWFIGRFRRRNTILIGSSLLFGFLAAFAVNDTVALMGPPIALMISRVSGIDARAMFLLLAFSLTIGSVMTPLGNPQNMLIAISSGMPAPFITFVYRLSVPTIINLLVTPLVIKRVFRITDARVDVGVIPHEAIKNKKDALLAGLGLAVTVVALVVNDVMEMTGRPHIAEKGFIPFVISAGIYVFTSSPRRVLANVDWGTIIFFITMFITMNGVWRSGVLSPLLNLLLFDTGSKEMVVLGVTLSSIALSQLVSNVPFTGLYIPYLKSLGFTGLDAHVWLSLAAASTIAGNLTILGAASNVIVLETLESRYNATITFKEFLRVGAVVTAINTLIYMPFLLFFT